ncbi:gfo/Idh/MocA family oxidoreductase [Metabacillus sp. GX 13764]|uniref:Gfo/Idh/MocA family oxidoreductase n=1 Tax=Metabacillus kandeliae TaxID=2900151 RepID=UPI001E508FB0|nr:Gfo/Idh/MocA family oxidoreductase [Metabacillus kandeliae]MCD7032971.1 gfo/Idh/MocA family oxidoreductase [Metabacillus kandeliae]
MEDLKVCLIGLDTSHAEIFARLISDGHDSNKLKGVRITAAYPGGSHDFPRSRDRVEKYVQIVSETYQVPIVSLPEEAAEAADAIIMTAVDGRAHEELFEKVSGFRKPVFIDKPFAVNTGSARRMVQRAEDLGVPLMSSSALRFDDTLNSLLESEEEGVSGADCFGPMELEPMQPGLFWYGIHSAEMLYSIMGKGCRRVFADYAKSTEHVIAEWDDGRTGTIRGTRSGHGFFGALVHFETKPAFVEVQKTARSYYASLLEQILSFFCTGSPVPPLDETLEIIRFIEAANESRNEGGKWICL